MDIFKNIREKIKAKKQQKALKKEKKEQNVLISPKADKGREPKK